MKIEKILDVIFEILIFIILIWGIWTEEYVMCIMLLLMETNKRLLDLRGRK